MKYLDELLANYANVAEIAHIEVKKLTNDNRKTDKDTVWLATKGISSHALDYWHKDQNCAAIVYEKPYPNPPPSAIGIDNLHLHIGNIARDFFDNPSAKLRLIGITGTDGKSSLASFLGQIYQGAIIGTIGNGMLDNLQESTNTTPDAFSIHKMLHEFLLDGVKTVLMEVSSHALDQNRVQGLEFDTAIFTNLSRDHFDYHLNQENYFQAKAKLFSRSLAQAIINIDDPFGQRLIDENLIYPHAEVFSVSTRQKSADIQISEIMQNEYGSDFTINFAGEKALVHTPIWARFNIDNLALVSAVLLAAGEKLSKVAQDISELGSVCGRVEIINLDGNRRAIVDYAHTPKALESVICGLKPHLFGKLMVIFGCGGDRDKGKRPLMAEVCEKYADKVFITDDNPRTEDPQEIIKDIVKGLKNPDAVEIIRPREMAIYQALSQLAEGDTLLVAGKGHEQYQIIGKNKTYYSDQETIQKCWQKIKENSTQVN